MERKRPARDRGKRVHANALAWPACGLDGAPGRCERSTMRDAGATIDPDLAALFAAARQVRKRAHAPYSGFAVGAAILDEAGAVHAGCNVENAAYPVGTCAEAGAIAAMVAAGGRRIRAVLVLAEGPVPVTPCGACRQRIREFAEPDTPIHAADPQGLRARYTLDALLPASFGPEHLGVG